MERTEGLTLEHLAAGIRAHGVTAELERLGGNVWALAVDVHGPHSQCVIVQIEQGMRSSVFPCAVEVSANFPPDPANPDASPFAEFALAGPMAVAFLPDAVVNFARRLRRIPDALESMRPANLDTCGDCDHIVGGECNCCVCR